MGELHLDILVDRMKREFNVEANVGKPQVAYRETIASSVIDIDYTHKKQTGGSGQFAKVRSHGATRGDGRDGVRFDNKVTGGRIPREYIPSVDAGFQDAMQVAFWLATQWWMFKSHFLMVRTTTLTHRNWRSNCWYRWLSRRRAELVQNSARATDGVEVRTPEEYHGRCHR